MKKSEQSKIYNQVFVNRILENKEVLFGKHSNKITQDEKNKIWDAIGSELTTAGAASFAGKNAKELSIKFSDMKRRTMEKMEKKGKTGEGKVILTEVDERILDIVGRDSAAVKGLEIADSENAPTQFELAQSSSRKSVKDEDTISADAGEEEVIVDSPQSSPVHSPPQFNYAEYVKSRGYDIPGTSMQKQILNTIAATKLQVQTPKIEDRQKKNNAESQNQGQKRKRNFQWDDELKVAKMEYYVAQKELADQQKAESAVRTKLLQLQLQEKEYHMRMMMQEPTGMDLTLGGIEDNIAS